MQTIALRASVEPVWHVLKRKRRPPIAWRQTEQFFWYPALKLSSQSLNFSLRVGGRRRTSVE